MASVVVGLDIGKRQDPTAIAIVELQTRDRTTAYRTPQTEAVFVTRALGRLPLGTPYPDVATAVADELWSLRHRDPESHPMLRVDATGVGSPIVDLLQEQLPVGCGLVPVTFTATERSVHTERGELRVGKGFMVSRLQALLQTRRIWLPRTREAEALADELRDYEIRIDERGRLTSGAMRTGAHDDLVTALGLAVLNDGPSHFGHVLVRERGVMSDVMTMGF